MSYFNSAENLEITQQRAIKELLNHGVKEINVFFQEVKPIRFESLEPVYNAQEVLSWLGY